MKSFSSESKDLKVLFQIYYGNTDEVEIVFLALPKVRCFQKKRGADYKNGEIRGKEIL